MYSTATASSEVGGLWGRGGEYSADTCTHVKTYLLRSIVKDDINRHTYVHTHTHTDIYIYIHRTTRTSTTRYELP